jgi:hypothetical protein
MRKKINTTRLDYWTHARIPIAALVLALKKEWAVTRM